MGRGGPRDGVGQACDWILGVGGFFRFSQLSCKTSKSMHGLVDMK